MKLSEQTTQKLIQLITVENKYTAGDKLPSENELANELGVSRNTLRSAIQYLVGHGVLEIKRGRGTYVSTNSAINSDYGFSKLRIEDMKLKDLYELRTALEPELAYHAATRATAEELESIVRIGELLRSHQLNGIDDSEGNNLFHLSIVKAAHNEFGVHLYNMISNAFLQLFRDGRLSQRIDDFYLDHDLIMDYLKKRNPEGARLAMKLHLLNSISFYKLVLQ